MSYALFLFVLLISTGCYLAVRVFGHSPKFAVVFERVADFFVMLPVFCLSIIFFSLGVFGVFLVVQFALDLFGLLNTVEHLRFWPLLPRWAWFLAAIAAAYCGMLLWTLYRGNRS